MTAAIDIRGERPGDEDAIEAVVTSAFQRKEEANIVTLMRTCHPTFDPRFSVTAWAGEELVGHTLFTPARIRLMGQTLPALAVAPVATAPDWQRRGIGGRMLAFGHDLGRREGFALTFLCGHPDYYPRFGYKACHGFGRIDVDADKLPQPSMELRRLPATAADVPWLVARWAAEWNDVDFGWLRGDDLREWTAPYINTLMWWTGDGRRAAYTIGKRLLLADDPDLARQVLFTLRPAKLEHHPAGWLARSAIDAAWAKAAVASSTAAMAYELREGVLDDYLRAVEAGDRLTGFTPWPLPILASC